MHDVKGNFRTVMCTLKISWIIIEPRSFHFPPEPPPPPANAIIIILNVSLDFVFEKT